MLDRPIEYLKGIGPQRAEVLKKELNIFLYKDLLTYFPFRYVDRTKFYTISEAADEMPFIQLRGFLLKMELIGQKNTKRLVVLFKDNTGIIELVWFKSYNWVSKQLKLGSEYIVFGKPSLFNGKFNIPHPEISIITEDLLKQQSAFQSVYNSTEKLKLFGLDSEGIRKAQRNLLIQLQITDIQENLSNELINDYHLMSRFEAFKYIHFPNSNKQIKEATLRLKFEELFYIQLRLLKINKIRANTVKGFVFSKVGILFNDFFKLHLPLN